MTDKNLEQEILEFLKEGKKDLTEISNQFWDKGYSGLKVDVELASLLRDRKIQKVPNGFFMYPDKPDDFKYDLVKPAKTPDFQYGAIAPKTSDDERFKRMDARIRALEIRIAELEKKNEDR